MRLWAQIKILPPSLVLLVFVCHVTSCVSVPLSCTSLLPHCPVTEPYSVNNFSFPPVFFLKPLYDVDHLYRVLCVFFPSWICVRVFSSLHSSPYVTSLLSSFALSLLIAQIDYDVVVTSCSIVWSHQWWLKISTGFFLTLAYGIIEFSRCPEIVWNAGSVYSILNIAAWLMSMRYVVSYHTLHEWGPCVHRYHM